MADKSNKAMHILRTDNEPELEYPGVTIMEYFVGRNHNGHDIFVINRMEDGKLAWRFSHVCTLKRSGYVMRIAPHIQLPDLYPTGHTLVSLDPLHIEPSILCDDCGLHGWVRDGKWVEA